MIETQSEVNGPETQEPEADPEAGGIKSDADSQQDETNAREIEKKGDEERRKRVEVDAEIERITIIERKQEVDEKKDVVIVDSLLQNVFRTLLIIGETGSGKSSLCNRIAGHEANSSIFPVSGGARSCTQSTVFGNIKYGGDSEKYVSLIDTIGFNDPNSDTDVKIIAELVSKLKNMCEYVNLFGIAVEGQNPRLAGSLIAMIKIFEEMFGDDFWKHCLITFTRMRMDESSVKRREKERSREVNKTDDEVARAYIKEVVEKFPKAEGNLKYLYLDACYDADDEAEEQCFNESMQKLYNMLEETPKLLTSQVNEKVHTENAKLKRAIYEAEKQQKQHLQAILKMKEETDQRIREEAEKNQQVMQKQREEIDQKIKADAERMHEMRAMMDQREAKQKEYEAATNDEKIRLKMEIIELQQAMDKKHKDEAQRLHQETEDKERKHEKEQQENVKILEALEKKHQGDLKRYQADMKETDKKLNDLIKMTKERETVDKEQKKKEEEDIAEVKKQKEEVMKKRDEAERLKHVEMKNHQAAVERYKADKAKSDKEISDLKIKVNIFKDGLELSSNGPAAKHQGKLFGVYDIDSGNECMDFPVYKQRHTVDGSFHHYLFR
jgi:hypothetical protein